MPLSKQNAAFESCDTEMMGQPVLAPCCSPIFPKTQGAPISVVSQANDSKTEPLSRRSLLITSAQFLMPSLPLPWTLHLLPQSSLLAHPLMTTWPFLLRTAGRGGVEKGEGGWKRGRSLGKAAVTYYERRLWAGLLPGHRQKLSFRHRPWVFSHLPGPGILFSEPDPLA